MAHPLLDAARAAGLSLAVAGDRLIVEADRDPPPALLTALRAHKSALLALLRSAGAASDPPAAPVAAPADRAWSDAEDERAAIIEHDGGVPRDWAEGFARLDPDLPPPYVPPPRWRLFIDDCGRFLDGGFAAHAAALGWGPHDLFGCDRDRPVARVDQAGLLWLLRGHRLVALTADTAVVETPTGARQTYRRRPHAPGRALAWELTSG
jgi:hypothetical protein